MGKSEFRCSWAWQRLGVCARTGLALIGLALVAPARAELSIDITQGVADPIPIAVVPFAHVGVADVGLDVADVVQHDLEGSGRFRTMPRHNMATQPQRASEVQVAPWRASGNDYVAVGRVTGGAGGDLAIECELVSLLTGEKLGGQRVTATAANLRMAAHQISDFIYEKIEGTRGAFATRIAYVSVTTEAGARHYRLVIADADGENRRVVLESLEPIMSPAWSADGQWLAYVSFENRVSAIFLQRLRTGERHQVSARSGVNGAPAFSPDGRQLALTLSGRDGNLDIFLLDLATQGLTRLTDDPAIDTEPAFSPDGKSLYFTSDRSGGPQIYRLALDNPQRVQRLTFGSPYNARARLSPDGRQLALVTRDGSAYRVAVQDLATGTVRTLSRGMLDVSPSFAPNGATLIFATQEGGRGALATVSLDAQVTQRLRSSEGAVREPIWGPFGQ